MRMMFVASALALLLVSGPAPATGQDRQSRHPPSWARATPPGAQVAGGYTIIENTGKTADRLVGGSLAAAAGFTVHDMSMQDGVMSMRAVEGGLEIPAGGTVE